MKRKESEAGALLMHVEIERENKAELQAIAAIREVSPGVMARQVFREWLAHQPEIAAVRRLRGKVEAAE